MEGNWIILCGKWHHFIVLQQIANFSEKIMPGLESKSHRLVDFVLVGTSVVLQKITNCRRDYPEFMFCFVDTHLALAVF